VSALIFGNWASFFHHGFQAQKRKLIMCSTFRIPSSLSLLKAAWIGYCSCKFCCNLDAIRRWRFAYKLLNVKRSSRNVCANLKNFFTWRRRTKCRNMRIKEELFHHMDCIGFFFYFLCSMWVLSVRSPCHVLSLQASITAESSKFWQKPTNCATLATFKNEWLSSKIWQKLTNCSILANIQE